MNAGDTSQVLLPSEERDLSLLWGSSSLDVSDIDGLSDRLSKQLASYEVENIEGVIESEVFVQDILTLVEGAGAQLTESSEWLNHYNLQLTHMRQYIEHIEAKNQRMETIAGNERALLAELQTMASLDIPDQIKLVLLQGELGTSSGLAAANKASIVLSRAIKVEIKGDLEDLLGVKEQRKIIDMLRTKFSERVSQYILRVFEKLAEDASKDHESASGDLQEHTDLHARLRGYLPLVHWIAEMDSQKFALLMKAYSKAFRSLYKKEIKHFFAELDKNIIKEQRDQKAFFSATSKGVEELSKAPPPSPAASSKGMKRRTIDRIFRSALGAAEAAVMSEQIFLCDFFLLPKQDKPSTSALQSEVEGLLAELFEGIVPYFNDLVERADKMDQFYPLAMLVDTDQYASCHEEGPEYSSFMIKMLYEIQMTIKVLFNRFLDGQIETIRATQAHVKQCGLLPFIAKFPLFVDRVEGLRGDKTARDALVSVIDTAYHKVVMALFSWLDSLGASEHQKFRYIARLENYHHFGDELGARRVPALDHYVKTAYEQFQTNMDNYASYLINRNFKPLCEFFREIDALLQTLPPEDIQFQSTHSNQALAKLADKAGPSFIERGLARALKNVVKNLSPQEGLVPDVWAALQQHFEDQYTHYEDLVARCYKNQRLPLAAKDLGSIARKVEEKIIKR